jgi:GNAT superfamily N-acetyltransferase
MINPRETLALFEREMRRDPIPASGSRVERLGPIVRIVGKENCVIFSDLDDTTARGVVVAQAEFFRRGSVEAEWKVFGYDRPENLESILADAGFVPEHMETLIVFDLQEGFLGGQLPEGIEVRQVVDDAGAHDATSANLAAFGPERRPSPVRYEEVFRDPNQALFVAYGDGLPVASGRLEMPPGRSFASLWGGGTAPAYRRRGVYRALVAARAAIARSRGYRFLTVDAQETSRPILERLGFVPLTTTRGWVLRPSLNGSDGKIGDLD